MCNWDCFYLAGTAINGIKTILDATDRNHRPQPVCMRGKTHASPENALEVLLSHALLDLDTRASHHA
jgi:hypothetical protein